MGLPGKSMFEGFNKNIISYKWIAQPNQRFKYNIGTKRLENAFTGFAVEYYGEIAKTGDNVVTEEPNNTNAQKWLIEYQNEADHGHDHS